MKSTRHTHAHTVWASSFLYLRTTSHLASGRTLRCSYIRSFLLHSCTACRSLHSLSCTHQYLWKHYHHVTCQSYFPPFFLKRVFLFEQIKFKQLWIFSPHPPPNIHSCWFITVPLVFLSSFPFRQCFIWHLFSSTNLWLKNSETQYKMKYTQTEI